MMAKAKDGATKTAGPTASTPVVVRAVIDWSEDLSTPYVNHAEIGHTKHEFFMLFGKLPSKVTKEKLEAAQAAGEIHIEPTIQLVFPPSLIGGLINALSEQREKFEKEYGPILDTWKKK